jgi:glycosyltransferase involved in cell wall biosynthesis
MVDPVPPISVENLPIPLHGRNGWPWANGNRSDVRNITGWPSITIVIPSFNQGDRIEAAIRSVLLQGYPNVELMVFDAGSTDGTVDVLRRYSPWLAHWESVPDHGQSHAINKGWLRARGEVFNWLCCDDLLVPGALAKVGAAFAKDETLDVLAGSAQVIAEFPGGRDMVMRPTPETLALMPQADPVPQPSCFWRRSAVRRRLLVRQGLRYSMDFELWMHLMSTGARWRCIDDILSVAHMTGDNKICRGGSGIIREIIHLNARYARGTPPLALWYLILRWPLDSIIIHADESWFASLLRPLQMLYTALLTPFYGMARIKALNAWSGLVSLRRSTRAHRRSLQKRTPRRANRAA